MSPRMLQAIAASLFLAAAVSASHIPSAPPRLLSETGLYVGNGTTTIEPRNRPFSPQYPLWSDGAHKSRWVRLPDGARRTGARTRGGTRSRRPAFRDE